MISSSSEQPNEQANATGEELGIIFWLIHSLVHQTQGLDQPVTWASGAGDKRCDVFYWRIEKVAMRTQRKEPLILLRTRWKRSQNQGCLGEFLKMLGNFLERYGRGWEFLENKQSTRG